MSDRITDEFVAPSPPSLQPTAEIPLLDDAIPLVRDEPWEWFALFLDDAQAPTDLTGDTVSAELRWTVGEVTVAAEVVDTGLVRLSLTAEQTAAMPFGQLLQLFLAINTDTEGVIPVVVLEGRFTP